MKNLIYVLTLGLLLSSSSIFAQNNPLTKTKKLNHRQVHQSKRIMQGVKSGSLTKKETANLTRQEIKLQRHKRRAKADGIVTPRERVKLNREANSLSRKIYIQKHDKQRRK
jgi:ketol-acid reductoisomerase